MVFRAKRTENCHETLKRKENSFGKPRCEWAILFVRGFSFVAFGCGVENVFSAGLFFQK